MKLHIRPICDNAGLDQWNGPIAVWSEIIRYNIRQIKPYTSDTSVEDITSENMYDNVNI